MPFISEVEAIWIQRFYTGWISLRNQLVTPIKMVGRRVIELYDSLLTGNDWECTPFLSLKRRAGHTAYVTINYAALYLYSWKSNTQGTIPVFSTTGDIEYVNSGGTVTQIYAKTASTGLGLQDSIFSVGDYLYVGDTQNNFKFDGPSGTQGKTNWGISVGATTTGLTTAVTGGQGGAGVSWTTPSNVTGSSGYASVAVTGTSGVSKILEATNYGFALATSSVISSITVSFTAYATGSGPSLALRAGLTTNGFTPAFTTFLAPVSSTPNTFSQTFFTGSSITATQINASTFGVILQTSSSSPGYTVFVQNVQINIATGPLPGATPTGTGTFAAVNGYTYVYAYGNSASGEISNATAPSINTGPFTNKAYVGVSVLASPDPQVNQIRVYRTTDSGGGNQFFEIQNSPFTNTTTTIQDTTPDLSLQVTSQAEINLGNTPPPTGLVNLEYFAGRMWGSTNNLLWASTGPETISGTAPNSNWNPLFQWVIPGVIVRNVTGPNGMLVFTQDDCYIVRGTDITNYTVNEFVKDFGIRSYNAVDTDGTNLYVFTSDRQFICVSASGANDLGLPIGDQLLNVNPNTVYVRVNRYGVDSIVRILDTANNVYYDYNLNQQCWNLPGILQMPACSAMGSIEVSPGVWRLLLCSTNSGVSQLAYRDINNFQDLGTSYAPKAVFGSIQLADPGSLAKFGALGGLVMEYTNAGTVPILSVLPNDMGATLSNAVGSQITGAFTSLSVAKNPFPWPPTLGAQPVNYRSLGYYWMYGVSKSGSLSAFVRHMQFQLSAPAENKATELIGFGIFGDLKQESAAPGAIPQLQGR